jgi:hypothetical protein
MSLTRATDENVKSLIDIAGVPQVPMYTTRVRFFSKEEGEQFLLYTEGLNPCVGVMLYGNVELKNEAKDQQNKLLPKNLSFVVLDHNAGVSSDGGEEKDIKKFCKDSIKFSLKQIEETYADDKKVEDIIKITLEQSFFIRCIQEEKNTQEEISAEFKNILSSTGRIQEIAKENKIENLNFSVSYKLSYREEKEEVVKTTDSKNLERELKETSHIDCYLKETLTGDLEVIYHHVSVEFSLNQGRSPKDEDDTAELEKEESNEEEDEEEEVEEEFSKKVEKDEKRTLREPLAKRKLKSLEPSESSSSSFSKSSQSIYSDSGNTLFSSSSSSSSISSSTSNLTSIHEGEATLSKKHRPGPSSTSR